MKTMAFLSNLKEFLLLTGKIYTVRKYNMVEEDILIESIGICHKKPLGRIGTADLDSFVSFSGLSDSLTWKKMIEKFIRDQNDNWFLYEVTLGG